MPSKSTPRDSRLIAALEALAHEPFTGVVWRVVREGRNPCQCSASGGRWDDGSFDVLYTSILRDGAMAEMYFHLLRGQPVFPSKVRYMLYELKVELSATLKLTTMSDLAALGLDVSRFGQLSYAERVQEYPRTQQIAEVAHFLDCDGIIAPSARWNCTNLIIFCDRIPPSALEIVNDHGIIDWAAWQKSNKVKF